MIIERGDDIICIEGLAIVEFDSTAKVKDPGLGSITSFMTFDQVSFKFTGVLGIE